LLQILVIACLLGGGALFFSCKKNKIITDSGAKISFSQDSVLFDTVFTTLGSATRQIRIRNFNDQRIKLSSVRLLGGAASQFILNLDGAKGTAFTDVEIAANDSMYLFVQVNVNPTNVNSPLIVEDKVEVVVNGNTQVLELQAWGQDAYYHRPTNAIKFSNGTYLRYSRISNRENVDTTWVNDKPHVIFGYLVVDSTQKLTIQAGVQLYFAPQSGLWVYRYGQLRVLGKKNQEVVFQSTRREKDYADESGQWERIWINQGSNLNRIDYAIIKNAVIGIQAQRFGTNLDLEEPARLTITNTKIQNMTHSGMLCIAYSVTAGNCVMSNCQQYCLYAYAGDYQFTQCTFANFWNKIKAREKPTVEVTNYSEAQVLPLRAYFGNCIVDGSRENELNFDVKADATYTPTYAISGSWIKTNAATTNTVVYRDVKAGSSLQYKDKDKYEFQPKAAETQLKFTSAAAINDGKRYTTDINGNPRVVSTSAGVTAGAYEPE